MAGRKPKPCTSASKITQELFAKVRALGFKQYWIAGKLNVEEQTLCRWKNGQTSMSILEAEAFADLLGGTVEFKER